MNFWDTRGLFGKGLGDVLEHITRHKNVAAYHSWNSGIEFVDLDRRVAKLQVGERDLMKAWGSGGLHGLTMLLSERVNRWLNPPARCAPPLRKRLKRERLKSTLSPKHWMGAA